MKYSDLVQCCERLAEDQISGWWLDDNDRESNHWSATLDVMREELGRDLTDVEITCLSLSRCYGPLPCIEEKDYQAVWLHLWPEGNPRGLRHDWSDLADMLRTM